MSRAPQVPLPFELPARLDFSQIPEDILRSSTLEAALAQNEDLQARLKVSLRRLSLLEEQVDQLTDSNLQIDKINRTLQDRMQIIDDKEHSYRQRLSDKDEQVAELKEQLSDVQRLWAQERSELQDEKHVLAQQLRSRERQLNSLTKYRTRIRELVEKLRFHAVDATQKATKLNIELESTRERIQALVDRLQTQGHDYHSQMQVMSHGYEQKIASLEQEIVALATENGHLREKCETMHSQLLRQTEIENRICELEKELKEGDAWREAAEKKSSENAILQRMHQSQERAIAQLKEENGRLNDQVLNLQSLWEQNRSHIEDLEAREESLQRLNQELAAQLTQMREKLTLRPQQKQILDSIDEQLTQILYSRENGDEKKTS